MRIEMGNFDIPNRFASKRKYLKPIKEFLDSDKETLKYSFEDRHEMMLCYNSLMGYRRRYGLDVEITRRDNNVYVIRRDKDADT